MSFSGFFGRFLLFSAKNIDFFTVLRYNEKKQERSFHRATVEMTARTVLAAAQGAGARRHAERREAANHTKDPILFKPDRRRAR